MSHRLTFHKGPCKNIHGHSYKMRIEIEGETNENMMVLDYYDIDKIIAPIINKLDHAFICSNDDDLMINFLDTNGFKYLVIDGFTTAENLVTYITNIIKPQFEAHKNIDVLKIRVYETLDAYAERKIELR